MGTWHDTDGRSVTIINETEVSDDDLRRAFMSNRELNALENWASYVTSASQEDGTRFKQRSGGIFERDRFVTPTKIFDQMKTARDASESDDVVSGVLEVTEALAFNDIRITCADPDEEEVWAKIADDIGLADLVRQMWREMFVCSQYYAATLFHSKNYRLDGQGEKRKRRKEYRLTVPRGVTILDPLKVVPYGNFMFGQEKLGYVADRAEAEDITRVLAAKNTSDLIVQELLKGKADLSRTELKRIQEVTGGSIQNVFDFKDGAVWRHTATRPGYSRFAPVRIKSIFQLLDLKHQLLAMDRAHLLGASNFIVVVKKGSDNLPATQPEITALTNSVRQVARTPLIVGDHRLSVEIVTPKVDMTLEPKRYNAMDSRIAARLYQIYHIGAFSAGANGDDSTKLTRVIARGIESRRKAIADDIQKHVIDRTFEMNANLKAKPSILFSPRNVALDFDPNFLRYMMELYTSGDLSRESVLSIMDYDQDEEFERRKLEKEKYDKTFLPRVQSPGQAGSKTGGNKNGGGMNPESMSPNPVPRRTEDDVPQKEKPKPKPDQQD